MKQISDQANVKQILSKWGQEEPPNITWNRRMLEGMPSPHFLRSLQDNGEEEADTAAQEAEDVPADENAGEDAG